MTGPVGETSQEPSHSLRGVNARSSLRSTRFVGLLHALLLRVGSEMAFVAEVGRVVVVVVVVALRCREVVVTWCCEIVRHGVVGCLTVWVLLSCCCGLGPLSLGGAIGGVHCSAVFNFLH